MADVAELVVRATPEGVSEVQDQLDGMTESVAESGEEMEDTAEGFSDLQSKFQGAGAAFAGAIAVTTGAFVGRVPVLAETTAALGAIFDSLGLKIDGLLRGAFTKLNNFLFGLSETINKAKGPLGNLVGAFALVATGVVGAVSAFASFAVAVLGPIAGLKATGAAILTVIKVLGSFIAGLISLPALAAVAIAGLAVLAFHFREEIKAAIMAGIDALGEFATKALKAGDEAVKAVVSFVGDIGDKFRGLVSKAREWGKNLIQQLISGIRSSAGALSNALGNINIAGGVTFGDVAGSAGGAADAGSDFIGSVSSGVGGVFLDGRNVENTQGRYRKDNLSRRGG